jgi:hypothetical protein
VAKLLIRQFLQPLLEFDHPSLGENIFGNPFDEDASYSWFGCTLQNFAAFEDGRNLRLVYFDFFLPHLRNKDGTLKRYEDNYRTSGTEIHEYRYCTKPGIIHNFFGGTPIIFFRSAARH